eukprot:4174893-Amphidinium_carterae.1
MARDGAALIAAKPELLTFGAPWEGTPETLSLDAAATQRGAFLVSDSQQQPMTCHESNHPKEQPPGYSPKAAAPDSPTAQN